MKIIDIGICIDNLDPKGIGRIRCVRYSDFVSEKERAMTYESWSNRDPFICSPFLPTNINFIPEIGQSVKVINYNPEKEQVNQEYIAGPFTTNHDFNGQTFTQQLENTTYGVPVKESPDVFQENGEYRNKQTEAAYAKKTDYAVYGKSGSDILFTENGLQLRGGKLLSKGSANVATSKKLMKFPIMAKKSSVLYLKKFPKKQILEKIPIKEIITNVKDLSLIVEYEIDSLTPTEVRFFVYDVQKTYGELLKTNFFGETTPLPTGAVKLINLDKTDTTPTHIIQLDNPTDAPNEIRNFLFDLNEKGLKKIDRKYKKHRKGSPESVHPFFFRPTPTFMTMIGSSGEMEFKNNLLNSIKIHSTAKPKSGLVWSVNQPHATTYNKDSIQEKLKVVRSSSEQSFSALKSDKIFFLSTDTNETDKKIDFYNLDKYDLTQENYLKDIEPNTFATVRGENLLTLLNSIVTVMFNHRHNLTEPMVKIGYNEYDQLQNLLKKMENDILNKSIRIN